MQKTNWKRLVNPDYLGAYSLDNGNGGYTDIVATIAAVKVENIVGADGKREDCMVMRFVERDIKPMIVNVTNAKMLAKLFKTPYIEDWSGRKIQIGVESVKAFGDVVDALRVRKTLPREESHKCGKCGADIVPTERMTVAQVEAYSRKNFGQAMCAGCVTAMVEEAKRKKQEEANNASQPTESN